MRLILYCAQKKKYVVGDQMWRQLVAFTIRAIKVEMQINIKHFVCSTKMCISKHCPTQNIAAKIIEYDIYYNYEYITQMINACVPNNLVWLQFSIDAFIVLIFNLP